MGKHRHGWPEAKKLCRLNQNDITMAKSLAFRPDTLVRSRPDPKQKWKLPVKQWIHELHFKRFGYVLGEKTLSPALPATTPEEDGEAARLYGEKLYWEDYWERNSDDREAPNSAASGPTPDAPWIVEDITDEDVPF